jgi:Putative exonuclease SbcCD, C subunit
LRTLQEASPEKLKSALKQLAQLVRTTSTRVRGAVQEESEALQKCREELAALQKQLDHLKFNRVMTTSPLLDELNRQLPRRSRDNPARQLRELCEVTDEEWRPALEVVFTRKFAVVVAEADYPEALRLYQALPHESKEESLVDSARALARNPRVVPNALARKIETADPIARAVVDELFGGVVCVTTLEELRHYPEAIMPDGFRLRGLFAERPRRYDQRPCIGAKGVDRLKAHLTARAEECVATQRGLEPLLARAEQVNQLIATHRLDSEDMEADISAALQLQELEGERDRLITRNTAALTPSLDDKIKAIQTLENTVQTLDRRRLELHGKLQSSERTQIQQQHGEAQRQCDRIEHAYQETLTAVGAFLSMTRCQELRQEFAEQYPTDNARVAQTQQRLHQLLARLPEIHARLDLLRQGLVDHHPEFRAEPDFDPQTAWNPSYAKLLERITVADMPTRQQQAKDEEVRWQSLFRTTVAARLSSKILDVNKTINDLNTQLKKPIGDSQYHIRADKNPAQEFQDYQQVLQACALTQEGESIFASLSEEARTGVERIFRALVEEPEGKQAQAFLDYRSYFKYDMEVRDPKRPELPAKSLNRHADKFSGGEKQTPFYISILACYLRAYKRHQSARFTEPSLGLVAIDEAFAKMSGERITDAIRALRDTDLQGILSMTSGNWPYAIAECDQTLAIHKRESYVEGRKQIRNIGALLNRQRALARSQDWS